jgi:hypothetical protein
MFKPYQVFILLPLSLRERARGEGDQTPLIPIPARIEILTDFPSPSGRGQRVREIIPRSSLTPTPLPLRGRGEFYKIGAVVRYAHISFTRT